LASRAIGDVIVIVHIFRARRVVDRKEADVRRGIRVTLMTVAAALAGGLGASAALASDNGLAPTPPMGFNSWNAYGCDTGAQNMERVADFMHSSGLERDGYTYVNTDGCYDDLEGVASPNTYAVNAPQSLDPETCGAINGRLPDGELFINSYMFPPSRPCADDGLQIVGDHLHALGLKLGVYLDASNNWNCEEIPGTYGFDQIDASTLADWGVDFVKADWGCADSTQAPGSNGPPGYSGIDAAPGNTGFGGPTFSTNPAYDTDQQQTQIDMYTALSNALANASRPMVFSIAGAGTVDSQQWGPPIADMVRPTGDSNANFTATGRRAAGSVVGIVNADAESYDQSTGPGHWVDPDMMEVGNGSLTPTEDRSEMSMFSEMADPLLMSTNLCPSNCGPNTTPASRAQLKLDVSVFGNRRVIAVDQDPLGAPAQIVGTFDQTHLIMAKPLADGDVAVTLFNEDTLNAAAMRTTASAIGLSGSQKYRLTNLWTGRVTTTTGTISASVPATATVMYVVAPASQSAATARRETQLARAAASPAHRHPTAGTSRTRAGRSDTADDAIPGNLLSVSCPADDQCTGVDILGQEVTFDPSSPAGAHVAALRRTTLDSVDCIALDDCVGLTRNGSVFTFDPQVAHPRAGAVQALDPGAGEPTALSCPAFDRCVIVDGRGEEVTFNPSHLRGEHPTRAAVDADVYLAAISCPSTTQCTATGGGGNGGDSVVTFDPSDGSVIAGPTSIDPATGNGLSSVACPSTSQCTAADGSGNEVTFDPTSETVNGAGVVGLEGSVASGQGVINDVACSSATQCTTVDAYGNEVTFDPTSGTVNPAGVQSIDPDGDGLESVACSSTTDQCTAVDLDGDAVTFSPSTGTVSDAGVTVVDPGSS
jgi:alpha-galactosidase